MHPLIQTLFITSLLGILTSIIAKKRHNTIILSSTFYWVGWLFVEISALLGDIYGWNYSSVSENACLFINQLHYGATIGFITAILVTRKQYYTTTQHNLAKLLDVALLIQSKITRKALTILVIIGCIIIADKIRTYGISSNIYQEMRSSYLHSTRSPFEWLGNHLTILCVFFVIILGIVDGIQNINLKNITIFLLAAAPLGIANGARVFLMQTFIAYLCSFLSIRSLTSSTRNIFSQKEFQQLSYFFASAVFLFVLLGTAKNSGDTLSLKTVLGWPASSIAALDSWASVAQVSPPTNGYMTFMWPATILHKLNFFDFSNQSEVLINAKYFFFTRKDSACVIPRTIIPDLIFDFGASGVFFGMLILSFFLQLATLTWKGVSIVKHTIASQILFFSFTTVQYSIFVTGFCVPIFWAIICSLSLHFNKHILHKDFKKKHYASQRIT